MEALGTQDAAFLFLENECNHLQIAAVAIFDGPPHPSGASSVGPPTSVTSATSENPPALSAPIT